MIGDKVKIWFAAYAINNKKEPGEVYITLKLNSVSVLNLSNRLDQGNFELIVREPTSFAFFHSILPQCREGGRTLWTITE